ncbi:uncharacterized protein LOC109528610 [Hippocampus comes]|uniref:uncharacterized protein LOC109528610 n=1 Tax=Hippocampus comes TaxID=109280 RepID=UPI00094E37DD|nr:PREDICTED: uncharacterized protein LOC109528610 [Hippocampus comes]
MAGNLSIKSINNRKYSSEDTVEVTSGGSLDTIHTAAKKTNVTRSTDSGSPWWTKEHLPAVENLWALTLQSALPYLKEKQWEVPDFPHPSSTEDTSHVLDEVLPFPEPPPASQQCPDLPASSSQQSKAGLDIADRSLSSLIHHEHKGNFVTVRGRAEEDHTSLNAIAGPSRVKRGGKKQDRKAEVEKRLMVQAHALDSQPLGEEENIFEERMETEEGEGKKSSGTKSREQALHKLDKCPMCLLVFPVGASQMDRDGHLAQCLSEMNVDMSW